MLHHIVSVSIIFGLGSHNMLKFTKFGGRSVMRDCKLLQLFVDRFMKEKRD